jgi:hypothetical protein
MNLLVLADDDGVRPGSGRRWPWLLASAFRAEQENEPRGFGWHHLQLRTALS